MNSELSYKLPKGRHRRLFQAITHYSAVIVTERHPLLVNGLHMAAIFV